MLTRAAPRALFLVGAMVLGVVGAVVPSPSARADDGPCAGSRTQVVCDVAAPGSSGPVRHGPGPEDTHARPVGDDGRTSGSGAGDAAVSCDPADPTCMQGYCPWEAPEVCANQGLGLGGVAGAQVRQQAAPLPPPPAAVVAQYARTRLAPAAMSVSTAPAGSTYVQLSTFLWVTGGWLPASRTVEVRGRAVTVTVAPYRVDWDTGEGSVSCAGPGTPYRPGMTSSDCSYTYRHSSASQGGAGNDRAYPVSAAVRYRVSWTCAGNCDQPAGALADLVIPTGAAPLRVLERQAEVVGR